MGLLLARGFLCGFLCPAQPLREHSTVGEGSSLKTRHGWGLRGCTISLTLKYFQFVSWGGPTNS